MPPKNKDEPADVLIDPDKTHIKIRLGIIISILSAVITGTVGVVTFYLNTASKADLTKLTDLVRQQALEITTLKSNTDDIKEMRVRVEFLTEQLLIEARGSSAARQRVEKAYSQVNSTDKRFDEGKKEVVSLAEVMTKLGPTPLPAKEMVAESKPKKPSKNPKAPFIIHAVEAQPETIKNVAPLPLKVIAPSDRAAVIPPKDTEKR